MPDPRKDHRKQPSERLIIIMSQGVFNPLMLSLSFKHLLASLLNAQIII